MPLGLDYGDLAVGASVGREILDRADDARMKEIQLQEARRAIGMQELMDAYKRQQAPVAFAAERAGLVQKINPINWERLSQIVGDEGAKAVLDAQNMNKQIFAAPARQIESPTGPIQMNVPPKGDYGEVGSDVKNIIKGKEGDGQQTPKLQLKPKGNRIPQGTRQLSPAIVEVRSQLSSMTDEDFSNFAVQQFMSPPEGMDLVEWQEAIKSELSTRRAMQARGPSSELSENRYRPQSTSGYNMSTESIMRLAGSVDPAQYLGEQEVGLAEKMISAESQAQAMALKAMQGAASTKTKADVEVEKMESDLTLKYLKAQGEADRALALQQLNEFARLRNTLLGNKTRPPSSRGGGGRSEDARREELEYKDLQAMLRAYTAARGRERRQMEAMLFPKLKAIEFPRNRSKMQTEYSEVFRDMERTQKRAPNSLDQSSMAPEMALPPTEIKNNLITFFNNNRSVSQETWMRLKQRAINSGVPEDEMNAMESAFSQYITKPISGRSAR
jgi:hypothetical protein